MNMLPIIDKLAERTRANVNIESEDYKNDQGLWMCGKCHTPKQVRITVHGEVREPYCLCKCEGEKAEARHREEERAKVMAEVPAMRERCFRRLVKNPDGKEDVTASVCETWTFANDDGDDPVTSKMARAYVEHWGEMYANNKGLLLYGGTGGGKSFFAACIANALLDQAIPCYFTNVAEIVSRVRSGDRSEIDGLSRYKLLVLDDLGVERSTEYMSEMVYNIVDARIRSGLPLIVTSNYTASEIKGATDMQIKRVFSRLYEACIPYEVKHEDRRRQRLVQDIGHYKALLGLEGT